MIASKEDYAIAADKIRDCTVALVYAHSFDREVLGSYYLRQRTEILAGYADVIDLLGAYPVFYNIDQFIELCTRSEQSSKIDYVINVPGGSLNIDLITIISTLASKIQKPIFPAGATSISLGQNKPIAHCIARDLGWPVPEFVPFEKAGEFPTTLILKPKCGGDSYGVRTVEPSAIAELRVGDDYMLEEFIEGYDFTAYVHFSALTGRHEVLGTSVTIPANTDDRRWFWDNTSKLQSSGRGHKRFEIPVISREERQTTGAFEGLARRTCELFGVSSVARFDFRLPTYPDPIRDVDVSDCRFLELNVLPTVGPSGSWQRIIRRYLLNHGIVEQDIHPLMPKLPPMQAAMLYIFLSWVIQRGDGSATGVDQLK